MERYPDQWSSGSLIAMLQIHALNISDTDHTRDAEVVVAVLGIRLNVPLSFTFTSCKIMTRCPISWGVTTLHIKCKEAFTVEDEEAFTTREFSSVEDHYILYLANVTRC